MRYKSEAFGRFKEFRLEVENQTGRKIKTLRSDRGGEYLSGEFLDYLKENGILSQWTPPGTPQLNGVSERRNRTLLDMVRSMMSFTELPLSFWGYALETAAKLLNMAPSETVAQTPYQIWHGKPASYKYLRVWGSLAYVKRLVGDKLDSRSSLCRFVGYPKENCGFPLTIFLSSEGQPEYPNNLRGQACAKGYTQRPGVDFEETYSPVAMAKSIRIMLAIAAWYDYEIWQMDVKTAFLNGFVEEEIYMDQPEGFTSVGEEQKVSGSSVAFLMLYVDDILLIGNDVKMLGDTKVWLSTQFSMKNLGEASYILEIQDGKLKTRIPSCEAWVKLSKKQSPKTDEELRKMFDIPYASAVGSIQYAVQCTRPDVAFAFSVTSRYQACAGYIDASFQSDENDAKSQSGFVFKLNGGVVAWKRSKQDTTVDSTTEAEYIAASEAAKEAV
ncbi:UNVERIFIED_CONTAM: Retrovirus-related Pol polyprotein from transposon TNT 1-94 [Sesamum radiatum]|uniref:Retrovirus-related Pol polyprotein from transposon TNT 1-94 n=1 Tax=Sesamum radiatum TaxID=300843 RepID=A0AAW2UAL6_SESRA